MSRLRFEEEPLVDSSYSLRSEEVKRSKISFASSYEVFDLTKDDSDSPSPGSQSAQRSKKRSRTEKELPIQSSATSPQVSPRLSNFLNKKHKAATANVAAFDLPPSNDVILKSFHFGIDIEPIESVVIKAPPLDVPGEFLSSPHTSSSVSDSKPISCVDDTMIIAHMDEAACYPLVTEPEDGEDGKQAAQVTAPSLSNWLSKFLSTKRDSSAMMEPELDLEPSSDTFLAQFSASLPYDREHDDDDSDADSYSKIDIASGSNKLPFQAIDESLELLEGQKEEVLALTPITVQLFNLPYAAKEEEVRKLVHGLGVKIKSITLGEGTGKGSLPQGAASVEVLLSSRSSNCSTPSALLTLLRGLELGGRSLRASIAGDKRRTSLDSTRYFEDNISSKCNACGQTGHVAADCINAALPIPCHLCAGCDHEAIDCKNLVCFRCGDFGHHSRECNAKQTARLQKPILCSYCGSNYHEGSHCSSYMHLDEPTYLRHICSPWIRCMTCGGFGHAVCGLPTPSDQNPDLMQTQQVDIYCPNCGEVGHNIDICKQADIYKRRNENLSYCQAPKHDAFYKYNDCKSTLRCSLRLHAAPSLIEYFGYV
jgi:hypothetical protein